MQSRFFTDTATILKLSTTAVGSAGEILKVWTSYADVVGSFQNASGNWNVLTNIEAYRKTKMFYCNPSTDIVEGDMLRYESRDYDVMDAPIYFGNHMQIMLQYKGST